MLKEYALFVAVVLVCLATERGFPDDAGKTFQNSGSWSEGVTACATVIIALFTFTLWRATTRQGKLTKEALIADKRAFVFANDVSSFWELDPTSGHYNWRFRPVWENSGETPSKKLRVYCACELRNTPLPTGFDFNQLATPAGTGLVPPKSHKLGGVAPAWPAAAITPQDILDTQAGKKFIYLWGWVRYFDVFPRTPEHITRFCWQILPVGDPVAFVPGQTPNQPGSLSFSTSHHSEGNCADEECS